MQTRQSAPRLQKQLSAKENQTIQGKGQASLTNGTKTTRRFGEDLTNIASGQRKAGPVKPGQLRGTFKSLFFHNQFQNAVIKKIFSGDLKRLITNLEKKAEAKAAPAVTTRSSARKALVPELEYAYFDETKHSYKDPYAECMPRPYSCSEQCLIFYSSHGLPELTSLDFIWCPFAIARGG